MADAGSELLEQPPIMTIESERLQLKTIQMSDLPAVMPIITDMEVMKWTTQGPPANIEQAERWLSARTLGSDVFNFVMREKTSDGVGSEIVGIMGSFHVPKCGYLIRTDRAGKGYATEALRAFLPAYFERVPPASEGGTGVDFIEGYVDVENKASQRVLDKCGFTLCESLPGEIENLMGLRDVLLYRCPRPGRTLEELGLIRSPQALEDPPEPPVQ
ncbi:hypothetical protein PRZ48_010757 [Zasmidium cellare]|uniref:N-acetyltransferase domain-containing protein n=1 Tax=Zasmidium cellare TaxID=395010 RepID=A0ABR0EA45_ZASCE|nr:hypothetical protein PRZ48_010757 [Zasmidium cellare]